jgi:hypothetical protein
MNNKNFWFLLIAAVAATVTAVKAWEKVDKAA